MVMYKCPHCDKEFKQKIDFKRHMDRKISCKYDVQVPEQAYDIIDSKYSCKLCHKSYKHKYNLVRHIKKYHNMNSEIIPDSFNILSKEENSSNDLKCLYCDKKFSYKRSAKRHMKDRCKMKTSHNIIENNSQPCIESIGEITTINDNSKNVNHNNSNMQVNNNFQLNAFGEENQSHLTDEYYKKIMGKGMLSMKLLVDKTFFDEKHPENHNLYLTNILSGYVRVYDGDDWYVDHWSDIVDNLYDKNINLLESRYDELKHEMSSKDRKIFERFLSNYSSKYTESEVKKIIRKLCYNRRKIVKKTIKNMDNKALLK